MDTVVTSRIPDEIAHQLSEIARTSNKKRGVIVREIVEQYVKKWVEQKTIEKQELASWESYLETGLHITGNEMELWLKTWGTDKEIAPPKCHV